MKGGGGGGEGRGMGGEGRWGGGEGKGGGEEVKGGGKGEERMRQEGRGRAKEGIASTTSHLLYR